MAVRNDVEVLRQVPMFAAVDGAYLQVMAFSSKRINLKAGQFLARKGKPSSSGFLVLDGRAEAIEYGKDEGSAKVIAEIGSGGFIGH